MAGTVSSAQHVKSSMKNSVGVSCLKGRSCCVNSPMARRLSSAFPSIIWSARYEGIFSFATNKAKSNNKRGVSAADSIHLCKWHIELVDLICGVEGKALVTFQHLFSGYVQKIIRIRLFESSGIFTPGLDRNSLTNCCIGVRRSNSASLIF